VIVKNIPKHLDETRLKNIFEKCGQVTDVRIIFRDNKNRKFGFVGFKEEDAGDKACTKYNKTFIDTSRISVEIAKTADDPNLPRAWSKYHKDSSQYKMANGTTEQKNDKDTKQENPPEEKKEMSEEKKKKFLEYLNLMKSGNQSWNDDVRKLEQEKELEKISKAEKKKTSTKKNKDSDTQIEVVEEEAKKPVLLSKAEIKGLSPNVNGLPVDENRLFILNLPHSIDIQEFQKIFEKYGEVTEVKLPKEKDGKNKGYGYIKYSSHESAIRAYAELDQQIVLGRILRIKPAYAPKKLLYQNENGAENATTNENNFNEKEEEKDYANMTKEEKSSYKKEKKIQMMKKLKDSTNWNTLFLNPNTIIAEMTERYKLKKSDILGPDSENQAVKVALAETQIINETKEWLAENGVNTDIFKNDKKACKRSDVTILVKNIPYSTTEQDLQELFGHYGVVYKVILPPNKALAIVEFANAEYAQNAFKALAYYKFKREPLYLEWAPSGLIQEDEAPKDEIKDKGNEMEIDKQTKTLFIKNLNFETTESTLQKLFEKQKLGKMSIKIVRKDQLSCGYGFVEFETPDLALNALKKLQHMIVDGHKLELSVSQRKTEPKENKKKKKTNLEFENSTKIVVRNIPFEATKNEIRDLFKAFGELKTVRLPKKMSGLHRGFGFVEFVSVEEARNAFETLSNTHLYGRRLNIEWAKPEDSMEEIMKKVKK